MNAKPVERTQRFTMMLTPEERAALDAIAAAAHLDRSTYVRRALMVAINEQWGVIDNPQ